MRRRWLVAALALATLVPAACSSEADPMRGEDRAAPVDPAWWVDGDGPAASGSLLEVAVPVDPDAGRQRLLVRLRQAHVVSVPEACSASTVVRRRSFVQGRDLVCEVRPGAERVVVTVVVSGQQGDVVGGRVALTVDGEPRRSDLPQRAVSGRSTIEPDLRLVSSPDFLNADVADLAAGPTSWSPEVSANSTNDDYERALAAVLDDWRALDPAGVLVAGDLVDGRWGRDDQGTGTFGPVSTPEERVEAVRRAARTYYPQWQERFAERGLAVFPAIGDHELGDNPWGPEKRALLPTFRDEFTRVFTATADGEPVHPDHPEGPARLTAYAGRPTPDVQVVTLDVFDTTGPRVRVGLDPQQRDWFEGVLARAQADGVEWVLVQGHVPVVWPVRGRGSSLLHYPGGTGSDLWRLMREHGVDLYLSGEVHDTTAVERDGIVQVSHGGAFQFGLTTALVVDVHGDRLYLTLRDYQVRTGDTADGVRLWETVRAGMPADAQVVGDPATIGTATVHDGRLVSPSGILVPMS